MSEALTAGGNEQAARGRPPALDEAKRRLVLALLTNGFSRRMAARYVGCAHATIAHTAERDPAFAEELAQAEQSVDVEMLAAVRRAAGQDRYWRAAAWILERRNRAEFCLAKAASHDVPDNKPEPPRPDMPRGFLALAEAARLAPELDLNRLRDCLRMEGEIP